MKKRRNGKKATSGVPKYTIIGLVLGCVAIAMIVGLVIYSTFKRGKAGLGIGLAGFMAMIIGIIGLVLSIKGMKKKSCMYYTVPAISIGLNGLIVLATFVLYFIGLFF